MSGSLANELSYLFPEKFILVVYDPGERSRISARGNNIREVLLKVFEEFDSAKGGGHKDAVGASIASEDLDEFRKKLKRLLE